MTIKDGTLNPFYMESDYHGLYLYEDMGNGKNRKVYDKAFPHDQFINLLGDISRRKLAMLDGTVNLLEYTKKQSEINMQIQSALNPPVENTQETTEVMIAEEQLT